MNFAIDSLEAFLAREYKLVIVEIKQTFGSTPREAGTVMLVSPADTHGTIGGGQMEHMAIDHARALLAGVNDQLEMDIPLGPDIGQCCGGRVVLTFRIGDDATRAALDRKLRQRLQALPEVWLFGAGHVGRALADALLLLPLKTYAVETRKNELDLMSAGASHRLVAMPEAIVKEIAPGSAVVILTHDHALDFLIAREALARDDLAYVGMIGSRTKRATFSNWAKKDGLGDEAIGRLVLPIGGKAVSDKRPSVIAAMTAAEILVALHAR
ncbi:xanthine dehydrogenase accessory protein XdhC [Rhizobium sp. Root73]|uniref:xanthine dehydrogenase accessory protein XdhC n=1 Tax=unclassified Rhizobium TaxID=2613769 RepID=UPI000714B40B|nr:MULTISPECIES: xanthine dehydrogenase accessory protein XdhC [unclassified Rhizobium]KQV29868.1 xanthine dehydrogenase accessory protein XdhC [Rhizobium sp. Root1204]KQY05000.1 xanthine dehydrogenase accessory protein XdhC [Rhizobium sp. Root1334]KRC01642.1 xanthine dehydrogenase accessory protein XdhC [Rhizobium sp. Root73]